MAKQIIRKDLGYLGPEFQEELVKCFIEDQPFFKSVVQIVDQNMFTDDNLRRIVGYMKDRYAMTESVATYKDLDIMIRSKITDAISVERCTAMLEKLRTKDDISGIDLIEGCAEKFFKQQNLTKAINMAQEIIKEGNSERYLEIEDIVKKALEANNKKDMGYRVFDNMEEVLSDDYRQTIPTGATELDKALGGGLGKGELGVIIAPSGIGKTSATTGFAANAAVTKTEDNGYQGYKVLHIHFEDTVANIKRKYYAFLTDIDACDLSKPDFRPVAIEMINKHEWKDMIQRNVVGWHPISGETSASDIKAKVKQLIANGFKPDLVIVDYFECMKLEKAESIEDKEYTREGLSMRKLESIADEFNLALWCPIQGTKDSFNQQIVGMTQGGGSVKKVQIGHIVLSLAKTDQMAVEGKVNIFVNKFRPGRIDKMQFLGVSFNNGTTKFDFSTETTIDEAFEANQSYQTSMARQVRDSYRK